MSAGHQGTLRYHKKVKQKKKKEPTREQGVSDDACYNALVMVACIQLQNLMLALVF